MNVPWLDTGRARGDGKPLKMRITTWVEVIRACVREEAYVDATQKELELYRQTLYAIRTLLDFPDPSSIRQVRKMADDALAADEIEYERSYGGPRTT